jgi:hypothetical protein
MVYMEWNRSKPHHLFLRVVFIVSALLYIYYFVVVNQIRNAHGHNEIPYVGWKMKGGRREGKGGKEGGRKERKGGGKGESGNSCRSS